MPGKKHDHKPGIYPRGKDAKGRERWLIRYELPRDPSTGKRRQKAETFYGNKREAEKRLREILVQVDQKAFTAPSNMTVAQYMEEWLEKYRADHPVESTSDTAQSLITNHIIAEIGHLKLAELLPYHLDKLYQKLRKKADKGGKGLSTRTVRYIHTLVNSALERAVDLQLIPANPAAKVKPPKLHQREVKPLTDEQRDLFLQAARDSRFYNLFVIALGTGMRMGELLRLTWDQINFAERTLTIVNMLDDEDDEGATDAKREGSKRTIPLVPDVVRALKAQRAAQAEEKLKAGPAYEDKKLVFANALGRPINPSNLRNRYFKPVLDKAGLPRDTHFHALRHTFATSLLRKGMDIKKVSAWLGHANAGFTYRVYHHYLPEKLDDREAERLNSFLFGSGDTKKAGSS